MEGLGFGIAAEDRLHFALVPQDATLYGLVVALARGHHLAAVPRQQVPYAPQQRSLGSTHLLGPASIRLRDDVQQRLELARKARF